MLILGTKFMGQIKNATYMSHKHRVMFDNFNKTFLVGITAKWATLVKDWDMDKRKPNPYEEPLPGEFY